MGKKQNFEKIYVKFAVKSPVVFYMYLLVFIIIFLMISSKMQLESRQIYEAQIYGNKVTAVCSAMTNLSDDKIYVYKDKNQEVFTFHVKEANYQNGVLYFALIEEQSDISGDVMLEIVQGNQSLFQRIFRKAEGVL